MSLRTIESSLYTRLQTLLTTASPPGYVAAVVRVAGDRETQAKLESESPTTTNVVALAFDRMGPVETVSTARGAAQQTLMAARWRVRVIVRDVRAQVDALTTASTGLYALLDAVIAALTGYAATGLKPGERVRFVGLESVLHKPGRYIASALFETRYALVGIDRTETTESPLLILADINLESGSDAEPNPVAQLQVEP